MYTIFRYRDDEGLRNGAPRLLTTLPRKDELVQVEGEKQFRPRRVTEVVWTVGHLPEDVWVTVYLGEPTDQDPPV